MRIFKYTGVIAAILCVISSLLGAILEWAGVSTNALIAHLIAAFGWTIVAIRDARDA